MYESFGNQTFSEGTPADSNSFRYTGREFDEETGLYYYRARYYDANVGRFLSEDPIGFGGGDLNLFSYVKGNPVRLVDPSGLSWLEFDRKKESINVYSRANKLLASFSATNIIDSNCAACRPWPKGHFKYSWWPPHREDGGPDTSYGSNGNFIFVVPGHSGMGVHSGRRYKGGPRHPTHGCIRTTDEATEFIKKLHFIEKDKLEYIDVK